MRRNTVSNAAANFASGPGSGTGTVSVLVQVYQHGVGLLAAIDAMAAASR
jgi:hypothetical protein